jgi:hypothetical protein
MPKQEKFLAKPISKSPNTFKRILCFVSKFIDYKMGAAGAIVMGAIVFGVNYYGTHELTGASTAALKQATYTFMFGGIIMRGCEILATKINRLWIALIAAIIIPSSVAIGLTFGVHSLKGTPKPVASTIPTAILVIPSTAAWGFRKRKQYTSGQASNPKPARLVRRV